MLIKSGAETNIKQENGETPLHIAAKKGNPGMVRLLLNEEGDPMITSKAGETALHVAARHCHYSVCKMLLEMVEKTKRREDAVVLVNQQTAVKFKSIYRL